MANWRCRWESCVCGKMVKWEAILLMLFVVRLQFATSTGEDEMPDFSTMPTPPSFKHEPNPPVHYFVVDLVDGKVQDNGDTSEIKETRLICDAAGVPEPKCFWKKNGEVLEVSDSARYSQQEGSGTLTIRKLEKSDEGLYQCFCENDNGTAYDREIDLKQKYIEYFPTTTMEVAEVELGKAFEKKCTPPRSVPPARIFWIFKDAAHGKSQLSSFNSINSSHIAMDDKGVIYLQYVKEQNSPSDLLFTCTAENVELNDYKFGDQFHIKVLKKPGESLPKFIPPAEQFVSPNQVTVLKGETLELYCVFSGFPDQKPTWSKSVGGEIDWSRVSFGTNFNKSIKIDNVGFQDGGTYVCSFESDVTHSRRREFQVTVEAAPYWTNEPPQSRNSSETEEETFICDAGGVPEPTFKFYKNGKELTSDGEHVIIEGEKLTVKDLKKAPDGQGDNAVYQCKAENQHGNVWANFYLNLLSFRPILMDDPGNVVAVVGQTKELACKFFGSPKPTVTWRSPVGLGSCGGSDFQDSVNKLHVCDVKKENEGWYECYAENKHGNASGRGYLTVREATRLVEYPKDETIVAGKPLRLRCLAETDPELQVKVAWMKHGYPIDITNPRYVVEKDNTLRIESAVGSDSAEYTCVAQSEHDQVNMSAKIVVRDVPTPPQNVWVKCDNSSMSAEVMFQYIEMSQEEPAREFWVQYNMGGDEPNYWETYPIPVSTLTNDFGTITPSLHPNGDFSFRVVARNNVGDSAPTLGDRKCRTPAAKPYRNPSKVLVKGNTPENLVVYWEPMQRREWNGDNFEYVVRYKPTSSGDEEWKEEVVNDPERNHVVLPAEGAYQSYDVQVKAKNDEGDAVSHPVTTQGFSGEEKPDKAPSGFEVMDRSANKPTVAKFIWEPYDASGFKGVFKGFKIEHWHKSNKRAEPIVKVAYFDPSATGGTVYDLKPYSENYARILAYSGGGDGPPSETRIFDMPEGFPSPVQDLEAFALSPTEVGVVWKRPREMNGVFKGYNVSWCPVERGEKYIINFDRCNHSFINESLHHRIVGLSPNTTHRVGVYCVTGAGLGEPNSADVKTLPLDVPFAVPEKPSVHESGVGEDHINVTWFPGKFNLDDPKPVGDNHYVEYRLQGDETWTKVPHQDGNFTIVVAGLQPGTTYEVRTVSVVDAKNGTTLESRSDIMVVKTAGEAPITTTAGWLIAIIVAIIILIVILIIVCLVVRNRGAKYPVSEKEKEQGREPMLKEERGFGEYARQEPDEEKRSLTAESKGESETDSMAEYGDGETGRFTEDGSFIGQYGAPNKAQQQPSSGSDRGRTNLSTFV